MTATSTHAVSHIAVIRAPTVRGCLRRGFKSSADVASAQAALITERLLSNWSNWKLPTHQRHTPP